MISSLILQATCYALMEVFYFLRFLVTFIKVTANTPIFEQGIERTQNASDVWVNVDILNIPSSENSLMGVCSADFTATQSGLYVENAPKYGESVALTTHPSELLKNQAGNLKYRVSSIKVNTHHDDILVFEEAFTTVERLMLSMSNLNTSNYSRLHDLEEAFQVLIDSYPKTELCDYSPSSVFAFSSICSLIAVYIEQIRFSHDVSSIDLNAAEICTCINFIEKLLYSPPVTESRLHGFCIDQLNLLTDRCLYLGEELQETHCFDGGAKKCVLLIEEGDYELNDVRGHNKCRSMIRLVENDIIQSVSL